MEQSSSWEANSHSANQIPCLLQEPEGSLPRSQVPTNGSYPEPDASSPHLLTIFP